MATALVTSIALRLAGRQIPVLDPGTPGGFALHLIVTTAFTTAVWLLVTRLTSPELQEVLSRFYLQVRPAGPGWRPIAAATGLAPPRGELSRNLVFWLLGTVFVYAIMFGTGGVIFRQSEKALVFGAVCAVTGLLLFAGLKGVRRAPEPKVDLSRSLE
jgi:hypothetical protein